MPWNTLHDANKRKYLHCESNNTSHYTCAVHIWHLAKMTNKQTRQVILLIDLQVVIIVWFFCLKNRSAPTGSPSRPSRLSDRARLVFSMLPSELGLPLPRQQQPHSSWRGSVRQLGLIMLLLALMWFVRLYLHYCSQWLYLQAIAVPVNKWVCFLWYRPERTHAHTYTRTHTHMGGRGYGYTYCTHTHTHSKATYTLSEHTNLCWH